MRGRLIGVAALVLVAGCSSAGHHPAAAKSSSWGGYPSYLPPATLVAGGVHTVVEASVEHPALASQGDAVRVRLHGGSVLATVVGPGVPNQGLAYQPPASQVTWTVTLTDVQGAVPLALSAFNSIDEDGRVYRLALSPLVPLPPVLRTGQSATFRLTTSMRTGEGRMRWIPSGHLAPVEWDFTVETD